MRKKGLIIFGIIFSLIIISVIAAIVWYFTEIKAPKNTQEEAEETVVEIKTGTSTADIIKLLKQNNVIKNELAAKIYIKLYEVKSLKAGKYLFTGKEDFPSVINTLVSGDVMDETITITFKEGKNMRYIAQEIAKNTNNTANDVYKLLKDENYLTSLKDKYGFLTDEIKNQNIYYPLEGYLYPDTYTFENKDVNVKTIFEKMLDQMSKVLTENKSKIRESKHTVHEVLTIASIIELEGTNKDNKSKIAGVIFNRLAANMSLGSDVTTYYAIRVDMGERNLYAKEINTYNAYNTRGPNMAGKLPVGPICNPSKESIEAALNPSNEKYLYFVADKNGEIYFSNTYEQHQETIASLKRKGLWYEYAE